MHGSARSAEIIAVTFTFRRSERMRDKKVGKSPLNWRQRVSAHLTIAKLAVIFAGLFPREQWRRYLR